MAEAAEFDKQMMTGLLSYLICGSDELHGGEEK